MDKSLIMAVFVFLAGLGSAFHVVQLQASNDYAFSLSNFDSYSSFQHNFPNSLVVMYTSAQYMGALNKPDVDTCPVPLAVMNSTGYTFISLYKPITGCNVNLLLLLRVEVLNHVSEARESGSIVVPNIRANKADFQVLKHKQKDGLATAVNLRLTSKKIMSDRSNHKCSQVDLHLIMIVDNLPFERQQHQPSFLYELITWVPSLIMLLFGILIVTNFFTVMDYVERLYLYGGPGIDPSEDSGRDRPYHPM